MKRIPAALALALLTSSALAADNAVIVTPGSGVTIRSVDVGSGVQSPMTQIGNSAGTNIVGAGTTLPVSGTVTATGTVAATQSGAWTVNPTTPASWSLAATAAAVPANATYIGMNVGGNLVGLTGTGTSLNVICTSGCAGAGGTSSNFGSAFPTPGTAVGFSDGTNMVSGRVTAYGTAPTGLNALAVNAFVTNTNANGQATMANSSPVTIASNQSAVSVTVSNANANGLASQANSAPVVEAPIPSSTGNIVANNTTAVVVKASPGTLYGVQVYGIGSIPAYLKFYNATSQTCGSGTPWKRIMIPAASTAANGAGSNVTFAAGISLSVGITYCVTTGITDADTTAPAASTYLVNIDWQ